MARISSYNQDDSLNKLDKVLGTDSGTGATKNYTIESLANTINEAGLVQIFDGAHYVFQSYVEPANNPQGVVNFNQSTASTVQYGNINTIYISVDDANGMFLADYLTNANGDYIKLNKRDDLNNFGIYKITNIAQPHSAYRTLTVQALSSAGFCQPGDKLFLSNYSARFETQLADHSVTELNDVTDAGSGRIITNSERDQMAYLTQHGLVHQDVIDNLSSELADWPLSANQGRVLNEAVQAINNLLTSDNIELDSLQEVVDFIEANRETLDALAISNIAGLQDALDAKEPRVEGKGLSANDFTDDLLQKLNDIAANAEVNVQADWNETQAVSDAFILNKPSDITDLSAHNAVELNDINDAGSGSIITGEERTKLGNITSIGSGSIITGEERAKLAGIDVDATARTVSEGGETITVPPANAEQNVQADWSVTDATSDAFIQNKPALAPSNAEQNVQADWSEENTASDAYILNKPDLAPANAEQNVQADWNEGLSTSDAFILNKPTDVTDLSQHNVTELNDISSTGSGAIITGDERNKLEGIAEGAEVNVQADWTQTDDTSDSFIKNKPSLAPSNAEQNVQADWSETDTNSDAYILNKPTLAPSNAEQNVQVDWNETNNTSDAFILNKPALAPSDAEANVQADWSETNTASDAYIQNKPDLAPSNAEQNVQANWNETDDTSDAFIQNKPALAPSDAEANVQANWNETVATSDAFIQNKPTDVTDLSVHNVTELNDISSAGSGSIITADERNKLADIAENAEVNVQADWNETNTASDAFILNKPTLAPSNAEQNVQANWSETDANSDAFILNKPSVVETSRTIQVQGSENEIIVSPNTAQDLSNNRSFTIGLPDDVTVASDLTVGDTIQLSNAQGSTPSFDNGIYYKTEDGHDTLHFRYHGHDLSIDHLTENIPTGILNGGVLSKANNTQFTIAAGNGVINVLNKSNSDPHPEIIQIEWSQGTYTVDGLDSNNTNQLNSWIYIDNTGTVQQQSTPLTDAQKRSNILIGSAIHSEGVLKFVKTFPLTGYNNMSQISEFIQTFGPMKKSGHRLSANGANLSLDRANGVSFALGRNYATDPLNPSTVTDGAKTQCVIHRYYQDGSGGFVLDDGPSGGGYTVIDPTKYDDGSGTLATVSGGHYSVQRFYYFPGTPDIVIAYYGHDEYNSLDEAENNYNKEDFVEAGNTAEQAIYLGAIIVKGGATALNVAGDAKFLTAGTFRSLAAVNVGGGISADVLNDLTDVNVQSPSNDDVLRYNASTQQFENVSDSILPISLDTINNRVGINDTTPSETLDVNGSVRVGNLKIQNAGGGRLGFNRNTSNGAIYDANHGAYQIQHAQAGYLEFQAYLGNGGYSGNFVFTDDAKFGIKNSNPEARLHVTGLSTGGGTSAFIIEASNGTDRFNFRDDGTMTWGASSNAGKLSWDTNEAMVFGQSGQALNLGANGNLDRLYINTTGFVGVNTNNPLQNFHTAGPAYFSGGTNAAFETGGDVHSNTAIIIDNGDKIKVRHGQYLRDLLHQDATNNVINLGSSGTSLVRGISLLPGHDGDAAGAQLRIYGGSTEYVRFDGYNKRVGINTPTPEYRLDFAKPSETHPDHKIRLGVRNGPGDGTGAALGTGLIFKANYPGYTKRSAGIVQIAQGNYFRSGLAFYTNGTADATTDWVERMRITMDGDVGIGTNSPARKLAVAGAIELTAADTTLHTGHAAIRRGSSGEMFLDAPGHISVTIDTNNNNTDRYFNVRKDSGSELFRIQENGNVGIDVVSPQEKLHVNGRIRHSGIVTTEGTNIDQIKTVDTTLQLTAGVWTDTGIDGSDLQTGTYAVQVYVEDNGVGGYHYDEYYSGIMSWTAGNTNADQVDEIVLHRAGHSPNTAHIQLRTERTWNADTHDLMLQIKSDRTYSAPMDGTNGSTITFKFRRLI